MTVSELIAVLGTVDGDITVSLPNSYDDGFSTVGIIEWNDGDGAPPDITIYPIDDLTDGETYGLCVWRASSVPNTGAVN